jgi:hypothetical protein
MLRPERMGQPDRRHLTTLNDFGQQFFPKAGRTAGSRGLELVIALAFLLQAAEEATQHRILQAELP